MTPLLSLLSCYKFKGNWWPVHLSRKLYSMHDSKEHYFKLHWEAVRRLSPWSILNYYVHLPSTCTFWFKFSLFVVHTENKRQRSGLSEVVSHRDLNQTEKLYFVKAECGAVREKESRLWGNYFLAVTFLAAGAVGSYLILVNLFKTSHLIFRDFLLSRH